MKLEITDKDILVSPRPMNDKQLMQLYCVADYRTWHKMISSIKWKLKDRKKEHRYCYNYKEVRWIFEHLGRPILIRE